jgi:hypothetical protein
VVSRGFKKVNRLKRFKRFKKFSSTSETFKPLELMEPKLGFGILLFEIYDIRNCEYKAKAKDPSA